MASTNPIKIFNYAIEIDGIDALLMQDVKEPETEVGAVKHGVGNYDEKTAGGVATSDAEIKKLISALPLDDETWNWLFAAQNPHTNSGGLESDYKKDIIFKKLAPNGAVLKAFIWEGSWVRKISNSNWKQGEQNENAIETLTISVDKVLPI